jgi:hypothetical protein
MNPFRPLPPSRDWNGFTLRLVVGFLAFEGALVFTSVLVR